MAATYADLTALQIAEVEACVVTFLLDDTFPIITQAKAVALFRKSNFLSKPPVVIIQAGAENGRQQSKRKVKGPLCSTSQEQKCSSDGNY